MRKLLLPAALAAAALAACGTSTVHAHPSTVTAPAASPSPSPTSSTAALLQVHDPGQLTWTGGKPQPGQCHAGDGGQLPDPHCTPGAVDPAVTQANIQNTICVSGYTATVRPPASQTSPAKYDVFYPAYSIPQDTPSELDHKVPLELGGANDSANLWPEAGTIPNPKDKVEGDLRAAVCSGKVTLAAAQDAIAADWETAEQTLGLQP